MWKLISSMRFAFYSLIALITWFFTGAILASFKSASPLFKQMNYRMLVEWFLNYGFENIWVFIWFVVLCIIAVLLGISLLLCTCGNLWKQFQKKRNIKLLLLFGIHITFIVILVFHVLSFLIGFKSGNLELYKGDVFADKSGNTIKVDNIVFVDDIRKLQKSSEKSKKEMNFNDFIPEKNYVELSLTKSDSTKHLGKTYMLNPFVKDEIRFTLEKFVVRNGKSGLEVGGVFIFSGNVLLFPFFVFYLFGIFQILIYVMVSWKKME